jgi:hypothetical protein
MVDWLDAEVQFYRRVRRRRSAVAGAIAGRADLLVTGGRDLDFGVLVDGDGTLPAVAGRHEE